MTFREIDEKMLSLVDGETGEILDYEAFSDLQMEKDAKAENMALWVLDLKDEAEALKREIERLQERKRAAERKADSLKQYLKIVLANQKLHTDTVTVSFRSSEAVDILDESAVIEWAQSTGKANEVLKYKEPEISKTAVKVLIKDGATVPGAMIVSNISTVIK